MSSLQLKRKSMPLPTQLKTELKWVRVCMYLMCLCVWVCVGGVNQLSSARWRSRPDFYFLWEGKLGFPEDSTPSHLFTGLLQVGVIVSESLPAASWAMHYYSEFPWLQFRPFICCIKWLSMPNMRKKWCVCVCVCVCVYIYTLSHRSEYTT